MNALSTLGTAMFTLFALTSAGCGANTGEPTGETSAAISSPDKPFKGVLSAQDVNTANGVDETGSGHATLLGAYTYSAAFVFNADGSADGLGVWTAANGDTLNTAAHAVAVGQNGSILQLVESHTLTGGTGRFEGASGSFQVSCNLNLDTNAVAATFDGSIKP